MLKIVEETLEGNTLKVKIETPMAKMARVPKKKYKTRDVIQILPEKYEVLEPLQEDVISNYATGNHKQLGEWHFKVKVVTTRKKAPAKKPVKKTPPPPSVETKTSTKSSIRGRMSKIAKEKLNKQ